MEIVELDWDWVKMGRKGFRGQKTRDQKRCAGPIEIVCQKPYLDSKALIMAVAVSKPI